MQRLLTSIAIAGVVVACGGNPTTSSNTTPTPVATSSPTTSPSTSPGTSPSPGVTPPPTTACAPADLCTGRAASATEESAMIAAGKAAFESAYGLKDISACGSGDDCFSVANPSGATVGSNAGYFRGEAHRLNGGGAGCVVYLRQDSSGWHFVSGGCAQSPGYLPGPQDRVYVPTACARVRALPSLSGKVLDCLPRGYVVDVDSPPVYADGYLWWHLRGRGWMAHDFLLWPKGVDT